jgi:hypothetical protein
VALETKRRLDLDVVAGVVQRVPDPQRLAAELGIAIQYAQRVEADVAGLSIDTLLPHSHSDHIGRFLEVWVPDESGHGVAQELLLAHLGVPIRPAADPDAVPFHNRVAGVLGRLSRHAYLIVSMTYHTIGSMNERLAIGAYSQIARVAKAAGADELADELYVPMRADESLHLGYYRTYAMQLRQVLAGWQLAAVRALIVNTWAPVGAGEKPDKVPFGEVLVALEEDPDDPSIAVLVQDIAQDLLAKEGETLPPFVRRQLLYCVGLARDAAVA